MVPQRNSNPCRRLEKAGRCRHRALRVRAGGLSRLRVEVTAPGAHRHLMLCGVHGSRPRPSGSLLVGFLRAGLCGSVRRARGIDLAESSVGFRLSSPPRPCEFGRSGDAGDNEQHSGRADHDPGGDQPASACRAGSRRGLIRQCRRWANCQCDDGGQSEHCQRQQQSTCDEHISFGVED